MKKKISSLATLLLSASFCEALLLGSPALAQETATDGPAAASEIASEDIVVTGTSIRGAAPVGSSLISLSSDDIEASTATTTDQILREIPQIFNYGVTDSSRSQSGGGGNLTYGNSINIRGIAPYATLTLINGRRAISQGTVGLNVDPSNIPAIALERVEIIADGASAVYGSDAISGVANLILRRRYDGLSATAEAGFADNYRTFTISGIFGTSWSTGRLTIAGQHSYRTALSGQDRNFYSMDLTGSGGGDYRQTQCNPGNIIVGSTSYAIPAGGASPGNLIAGTSNRCDTLKYTDLLPRQEINSATVTLDQDFGDSIHFFADGIYARRDGFRKAQAPIQNIVVPSSNAFFVQPAGSVLPLCAASVGAPVGATCETVQYNFAGLHGPTATNAIRSEMFQGTAGVNIDLTKGLGLNIYGTYGFDREVVDQVGNSLNPGNLALALASSNRATAFNPFGTSVNGPAVINPIFDFLASGRARQHFFDAGAKLDGGLFEMAGGTVSFAIGGEYNRFQLFTGFFRGPAGAQTATPVDQAQSVTSGYAELLIPFFGSGNAIPGFQSLTLDIAGRIDRYSSVGTTTNPKIGINWEPFDSVKLHGSYGTSFRAPGITEIYGRSGNSLNIANFFDPTANGGVGGTVRGVIVTGDNFSLKPETARTWSFGIDYKPTWLTGALLTLNYFDLVYRNQIVGNSSNTNILRQESIYSSVITRGASATSAINALIAQGYEVRSGSLAEAQSSPVLVDGRNVNLGITVTRGLDFGISVPWEISSLGKFRFNLNGIYFFTFKTAVSATSPVLEQINNINNPLRFRTRAALQFNNGPLNMNLYMNYQNSYKNTFTTPITRVKANTTVDISTSYELNSLFGGKQSVSLGLDVTNLFDKNPPFVDLGATANGGGGFDPNNASAIGRVVAVSLRTKF